MRAQGSSPKALSFEEFQEMLAGLLEVEASRLRPEAYFITDLGVDSIRMVEVLLQLEAMGLEVSLDLVWEVQTVGDAYRCYLESATGQAP